MRIVGIDPGANGGIVIINENAVIESVEVVRVIEKELDIFWFHSYLINNGLVGKKDHFIFLEKGQPMPGNGSPSIYTYGEHNGAIKAVLKMVKVPFELVAPQVWTRLMHAGCSAKLPKDKSREALARLYPEADLRDPNKPKSFRVHEGLMDAALIARFGLLKLLKDPKFSNLIGSVAV